MIVAAHQPHYMPWLGYLDKLAKADLFVVMDDLQFEAQNFQNRQRLKLAQGPAWITVPLEHGTQSDRICDKHIARSTSSRQDWRHRHWQTVLTNYSRAPYFDDYAEELHAVYTREWDTLLELDCHMLSLARRWLDIRTPVIKSSQLGLVGQKTDRLIDMCKKVGARCYLTGSGGSQGYLDAEKIGRSGIGVIWQTFVHPRYVQRHEKLGFASHLGFIDLVLNCGPASRDILFGSQHPSVLGPALAEIPHQFMEAA
jgi:hypothetical protein